MRTQGIGALVVVLAVALTGCQSGTEPAGSSDGAVGDEAGDIGGTVTLWYLEDPDFVFLPALVEEFEAAYPGVTVEMTEVPEDGFVTKIDTALLAGSPPDVAFIYEPRWMKSGAVLPLDDVIEAEGIDTSVFNQTALAECELDGQLYCLGSLLGSVVLIYNKDMFDAAGLPYPSPTDPMPVDEYAGLAAQLSTSGGGGPRWGATADVPFWWTGRWTHFSDDGRTIEGSVDDDDTLHMYDVLSGIAADGHAPLPSETDLVPASDMLADGSLAMAVTEMEFAALAMEEAGYNWGAAPPPVEREGADPFVFAGTDKYGVFAEGANPEAAKLLVAFLATEGSRIRVEVADDPPLDTRMLEEWAGDNPGRRDVVGVLSNSSPWILVPGFWEVTAPLVDLFALMVDGEIDPRTALADEAPMLQERLDREWATWEAIE
jgi:multiple sugar transport system substrate-binding protein